MAFNASPLSPFSKDNLKKYIMQNYFFFPFNRDNKICINIHPNSMSVSDSNSVSVSFLNICHLSSVKLS